MLSPLSREPSVGMFFVKAATHQVCQLRVSREIISIQSVQGRSEVSISSAFSAFFAAASSAFASTSGLTGNSIFAGRFQDRQTVRLANGCACRLASKKTAH